MDIRRQLHSNSPIYQKNGIKLLVLGHDGVGKTTLIQDLCDITNNVERNKQNAEILGALPELQYLEANLVDMPNLRPITINICDAFILMYAVDDVKSFEYVKTVAADITKTKGMNVPVMVVANKYDLDEHEVDQISADQVVTVSLNAEHIMVSAKTGVGIRNLFSVLLSFFGQHAVKLDKDDQERPLTVSQFL